MKKTPALINCPDCGKLILTRFPIHDCTPKKKKSKRTQRAKVAPTIKKKRAKEKAKEKVGARTTGKVKKKVKSSMAQRLHRRPAK